MCLFLYICILALLACTVEICWAASRQRWNDKFDGDAGNRAVIISTRLYHFEIAAVFAHHFTNMDLQPSIFLSHPVVEENHMGAFDWLRTYTRSLYVFADRGKRVNPILWGANSKVLVIVSSDESSDFLALCTRSDLYNKLFVGAEKVLLVMHNANSTEHIAQRCQDPKCSIIVLGENVFFTAKTILQQTNLTHVNLHWISSLHPLAPEYIAPRNTNGRTRLILQGILNPDKRRDFSQLFKCMNEIKGKYPIELVLIGKEVPSAKKLVIPQPLINITTIVKGPNYFDYFRNISSSDYALLFASFDFYSHHRITSSIPSSLVANLPIILPKKILRDYACLREQHVHKLVGKDDDCSSVKAALTLSSVLRKQFREEVASCVNDLLDQSRRTLRDVVFRNVTRKVRDDGAVTAQNTSMGGHEHISHRFCKL
eukprot:gene27129-32773_t